MKYLSNILGLSALVLIWLQVMTGLLIRPKNLYGKYKFYNLYIGEGLLALVLALTHPILLLGKGVIYQSWEILFGLAALYLMIVFALIVKVVKQSFVKKNWSRLGWLNYSIFWLVWLHGLVIASDGRLAPLTYLYYFMAGTIISATIFKLIIYKRYTYEKSFDLHHSDLRLLQDD